MRFCFFGSDDFSAAVLDEIKKAGLLPALVVTQPNRPKGRGLRLAPPPVKLWAQENGIQCLQPEKLDSGLHSTLNAKRSTLFVVVSYGVILPKHILDIPKHGTLNVHPSLLPKYRGATPIEGQILNDEKDIGVTVMLMDAELDHGPILAQKKLAEVKSRFANHLQSVLAVEGGKLLAEVMPKWVEGKIQAVPQDHDKATYTKKFAKADGEVDLNGDPYKNFLKIQALEGSIGTYFYYTEPKRNAANAEQTRKIRVLIKEARFENGTLHILRVLPEGKKEMSYAEFLRGLRSPPKK